MDISDFQLPVTIATELDDVHQMYHFFIVNIPKSLWTVPCNSRLLVDSLICVVSTKCPILLIG